jgi:hypothetical protein
MKKILAICAIGLVATAACTRTDMTRDATVYRETIVECIDQYTMGDGTIRYSDIVRCHNGTERVARLSSKKSYKPM